MRIFAAGAVWLSIVFAVVTMWNPAQWFVSIPEIAIFATATLLLGACAMGMYRPVLSPLMALLAAAVLWGLLQIETGHTVYIWQTKVAALYWGANAAVFFVALQAFSDRRARTLFLNALLAFAFLIAIVSSLQSLDPSGKVFWIFTPAPLKIPQFGPFPYKNQYAAFIELLLPFALLRALTEERRSLLNGVVAAVLYCSVMAAASRMGFFLVTAEMAIVPVVVMANRRISFRQIRGAVLFFFVILAMLAVAAGPDVMLKKFEDKDPYAGRREFTEASLRMVKDRPFLGFGLGTWATVYPSYALSDEGVFVNQAHDDWAQWAAEGGLPFFAIMLAIAVWIFPRALRTGWGLGVVAVFVHCLVDYPIQRVGVAFVMFAMLAAIAAEDSRPRPA